MSDRKDRHTENERKGRERCEKNSVLSAANSDSAALSAALCYKPQILVCLEYFQTDRVIILNSW